MSVVVFCVLLCNIVMQHLFIASNGRTEMLYILAYYHDGNSYYPSLYNTIYGLSDLQIVLVTLLCLGFERCGMWH